MDFFIVPVQLFNDDMTLDPYSRLRVPSSFIQLKKYGTVSGPANLRDLPFTHNIQPNVLDCLLSLGNATCLR